MELVDQQKYCDVIKTIFGNTLQGVEPSNISEDVAQTVDTILKEIEKCSRLVGFISEFLKAAVAPGASLKTLVVSAVKGLIGELKNNTLRLCVANAARTWKTDLQLKLMGV